MSSLGASKDRDSEIAANLCLDPEVCNWPSGRCVEPSRCKASTAAYPSRHPWFDHMTDQKPRLDHFRDPWHWLIDALPWFLRRFYLSAQYREWVPNGARYIGTRRPPWEAFDMGRKLHTHYSTETK